MKKSNPLHRWNDEALNYIAKLKSKVSHIKLSNFTKAFKLIRRDDNMVDDVLDIIEVLKQIDSEISNIYKNLTINNNISKINESRINMKAKDVILLSIKLYKRDLMKCCKLSYFKDGKIYHRYAKKDRDGVVYRNINRLYELRERRGNYLLEFIYSIYKELPRILRYERGE